jgi:hypothetical protein
VIKSVNIKAIRIDGGTQSRERLDQVVVSEYAELFKEGVEFPPISVVHDGSEYYLADGFHRLLAAQHAGKASINCDVITGTLRDAVLYSLSANHNHGLRRTIEDKRKAVMTMLEDIEWSEWSDREIARQCHVSHPFVTKMRASMQKPETGNVTTSKTKAAPKDKPVETPEPEVEEHDQKQEVIDELVVQNQKLTQRLAIELMEASPEEKQSAEKLIEELREEIRLLKIENQALTVSRDTFQSENGQMKKQIKMLQKKLKEAGVE